MTLDERRLMRHLFTAVAVKVALLALLWWAFVRDAHVPADAEQTAAHIGVTAPTSGVPQ
ncbi:MAG: cytochrome oxidase putative small subunit CydP [Burkholderiaceae bacterium]